MKTRNLVLLAIILITGQSCTIFSLNPLYNEEDLLVSQDLIGLWQDADDGDEYVSFQKYEDKKYILRYMEDNEDPNESDTISYETGLLKIGDHYFIDVYPYYDQGMEEEDYLFRSFIPAHAVLKIEWENDVMKLYTISYDRLNELFEQNRIRIRHQMLEDYIVITASTEELQKFLKKYADDEKAFDEPDKLVKIR